MNNNSHTLPEIVAFLDRAAHNQGDAVLCEEIKARLFEFAKLGLWAKEIRWSRIVADEKGVASGTFYYFGKRVDVVRAPEVTSTVNAAPEKACEDPSIIREQADAWREVANCLYDIDPDWHRNGKPYESAVKFIRQMRLDRMYAEFFSHVVTAVDSTKEKQSRQVGMSPLLGAPYGEQALKEWRETREHFQPAAQTVGREMSAAFKPGYIKQIGDAPATPPSDKALNYGKAPGEHPADIGGDQQ
jgi:hypothetical protein